MIFISHTSKDKPIVEPIALKIASVFGKDKVFYDSWSIQPGDGIIERMNEGLENCEFFFFFVSSNSLQSNMVTLEWQNALLKKTKGSVKFIPVKLDACMMPPILLQSLYIDVFGKGIEVGVRQIIDVINGQNTYHLENQEFENIVGHIEFISSSQCIVKFEARYYLEPISRYAIVMDNILEDILVEPIFDGIHITHKENNWRFPDGRTHNILFERVDRGTTPQFPYGVKLSTVSGESLRIVYLMRAIDMENMKKIPYYSNQMFDDVLISNEDTFQSNC